MSLGRHAIVNGDHSHAVHFDGAECHRLAHLAGAHDQCPAVDVQINASVSGVVAGGDEFETARFSLAYLSNRAIRTFAPAQVEHQVWQQSRAGE